MQTHPFEPDFLCRIVEVMRTKIRRQHLSHIIDTQIRNIDAKLLAYDGVPFFQLQQFCLQHFRQGQDALAVLRFQLADFIALIQ